MIRKMCHDDTEAIVAMIQTADTADREYILHQLGREGQALVYDDGEVKGLGLASTGKPGSIDLKLFVHPNFRRQGIGKRLWDMLQPTSAEDIMRVTTHYRVDEGDPSDFYSVHGFMPWYRMHQMFYTGGKLPETDLEIRPYGDELFADYTRLINDGFTRLREIGDFPPYRIYPEGCEADQELRQRVLKSHLGNTYLFYKNCQVVGVTELLDNEIDTVAVAPAWRGHGYGRQIMNFSINTLLERGAHPISLHVLGFNDPARQLYESMGLRIVQTLEYARWQRQEDDLSQTAAARC